MLEMKEVLKAGPLLSKEEAIVIGAVLLGLVIFEAMPKILNLIRNRRIK